MVKVFGNNGLEPRTIYFSKNPQHLEHTKPRWLWSASNEDTASGEKLSVASTVDSQTRLIKAVHCIYRRWVILLCSLITVICSAKVVLTPNENDITGYTPYGARSREELAIHDRFFGSGQEGTAFGAFLLIVPKSGNNLLDVDLLREVVGIDDVVRDNITMFNHVTNRNESFGQFCKDFCDLNQPVRTFFDAFQYQTDRLKHNESQHPRIELAYPVTTVYGRKINIQPNFYGISFATSPSSSSSIAEPAVLQTAGTPKSVDLLSNMQSVGMIAFIYKAERVGKWSDAEVRDYEMAISNYFEQWAIFYIYAPNISPTIFSEYKSDQLRVMSISTTYVTNEVVRAGMSMIPFLAFGFIIMAICSSCTVLLSAAYMQQVSVNKITLALMACVCPFMACGTALGMLFFAGVRFGSILCVTPFLVLAIGVDDAYLMIHAWQRVSRQMRRNPVKEDCVAYRLSLVLIDTGPAILISALTNITADAVGSFTGSPEITLLCVGNMASIFVDFIYQVTFYSSVMAIAGFYEMRADASRCYKLSIPVGVDPTAYTTIQPGQERRRRLGEEDQSFCCFRSNFHDTVQASFKRFVDGYVALITNSFVAFGVFLFWIAFIALSLVGISKFEVNLTTKKIFAQDSPLLEIDHIKEQQIVPFYTLATVFVNQPGDLGDPKRLERLHSLLYQLEHMPQSWGEKSSNFFLRDFLAYQQESSEDVDGESGDDVGSNVAFQHNRTSSAGQFNADELEKFLAWPEYQFWRGFLRIHTENNHTVLDSFFFTTAYHGKQLSLWPDRSRLLQSWRDVVDAYPEFNASVFHEEGVFLDLIDNMPTDTWQSALATLVCMAGICFIFMYNTFTVLVASTIIASIITGMLGTLSWQGVTMDPIMMAALIISIGFSVDIPAHVSYHFHTAGQENPALGVAERLRLTLASVGFPALQASLSTSLCVLSLLFVKLYMAHIFVQIMCLCILMCVLHSLVLLPALFSLIELITSLCQWRTRKGKRRRTLGADVKGAKTNGAQ